MKIKGKSFVFTISIILTALILVALINYLVDPYFHYSAPKEGEKIWLSESSARYMNDGILRHFDYDAIICGTSMTQNFKASQFNELFGVKSVKVVLTGASWKELNDQDRRALEYNPDVRYIIRSVDIDYVLDDKDKQYYADYPEYLYDGTGINDINYLLDKRALFVSAIDVALNVMGFDGRNMDTYGYSGDDDIPGITYEFVGGGTFQEQLSGEEKSVLYEHIHANITDIAHDNPKVKFLYFIPPYSICYFDKKESEGRLSKYIEGEHILIEECLKYDNIEIYAFYDDGDLTGNFQNYVDYKHYSHDINDYILECMSKKEHLITKNNFDEYCSKEEEVFKKAIKWQGLR